MFGRKRSNIVLLTKKEDQSKNTSLSQSLLNIEQEEKEEDFYKSTKYIFYDKKKFTDQMEIYISIKNYYKKKILIIISSDSSIEDLKNQIVQNLGSSPEYKKLSGLRVEEIYKSSNGNKIHLSQEGKITDFVKSGDILDCELATDEYWIKTYYNIQAFNFKKIIKLEYKLNKKMKYKKFRLMLMKGGIQLFIDNLMKSHVGYIYNYYVKMFEFKIKKHKSIITHNIHNKQNYKMTIDKIINFSSEIIVILKFDVFEKLIHRNMEIEDKNIGNILRLNEYNLLSFEDLENDKKFMPELNAIKELSEQFLKKQYNEENPNFLFFNKKKRKTKKNDDFPNKKSKKFLKEKKPLENLIEEEEEDKSGEISTNLNIEKIKINPKKDIKGINESDYSDNTLINTNIIITNEKKKENNNKSLFSNNISEIKADDLLEIKEKKEKTKSLIIVANFLIKEEEEIRILKQLETFKSFAFNFSNRNTISGMKPTKLAFNKKKAIYDNKSNINYLVEEENEEDSKMNNLNIEIVEKEENNNKEIINEVDSEVEFETKPKTFSDKNIFQNQLLFRSFNDSRIDKDQDDLFIKIKDEEKDGEKDEEKDGEKDGEKDEDKDDDNFGDKNILDLEIWNTNNFQSFKNSFKLDDNNNSFVKLDNNDELIAMYNKNRTFKRRGERRSTFNSKDKKSLIEKIRTESKPPNFYKIIKSMFNEDIFLNHMQKYYNSRYNKKMFDKIKMPKSKDIEYLDQEYTFLIETTDDRENDELKMGKGECHIYIFMIFLFLFSALFLISINIDLYSLFY